MKGVTKPEIVEPKPSAPASQPTTPPAVSDLARVGLRCDGIYQSSAYVTPGGHSYRFYLRFYSDGTVFQTSFSGQPTEFMQTFSKGVSTDKVTIRSNVFSFTVINASGTIDYTGVANTDGVHVDSHSNINGHQASEDYVFVKFEDGQGGEAASQHVVRAVESPDTQVAYDLPDGGITYGPPGGMKILNPEWPTGKPGESIAGSFGVNQQGELVMSVGFPQPARKAAARIAMALVLGEHFRIIILPPIISICKHSLAFMAGSLFRNIS